MDLSPKAVIMACVKAHQATKDALEKLESDYVECQLERDELYLKLWDAERKLGIPLPEGSFYLGQEPDLHGSPQANNVSDVWTTNKPELFSTHGALPVQAKGRPRADHA